MSVSWLLYMVLSTGGAAYVFPSLIQLSATTLDFQACEAYHAPSYYRSPSVTDVTDFELFQRQPLRRFCNAVSYSPGV